MTYKIFGSELSPYSIKVRSYFRYKGIPHAWTPRTPDNIEEFQRFAKLPLVPLVVTPEETGLQDSTAIIDELETRFPDPSVHPEEPISRFISVLLEEFGDEWGNKWMFHQRWARQADQLSAAGRIAGDLEDDAEKQKMVESILDRMVNRVWFVGSNEQTAPIIETSFRDGLAILDTHLADRPYRFDLPVQKIPDLGATHGAEIAFTFNAFAGGAPDSAFLYDRNDPVVRKLALDWSNTVIQFARTGNPNGAGLPDWPRYTAETREALILDDNPRVAADLNQADRTRWGDTEKTSSALQQGPGQ